MAQTFSSERAALSRTANARSSGRAPTAAPATTHEQRLAALQRSADASPATERLRQLRALEAGRAVQRAELDEDELMQGRFAPAEAPLQREEDDDLLQPKAEGPGGLPAQLQGAMQAMSGVDLGAVRVHYNSQAPSEVGAHAFAQGSDIHLASGQERHLPHEAWHVVQQKQGRVQPTTELGGVAINDSPALETEADQMGARAARMRREEM